MRRILLTIFAAVISLSCLAQGNSEPSGTYLYCQREDGDLYLDIYDPAPGSITEIDGVRKPTVIYVFGGGFKEGNRTPEWNSNFFKTLSEAGYSVAVIDYRLGLKGVKEMGTNLKSANMLYDAIQLAVEDLFAATNFLLENGDELNLNTSSIVISGSSAGAITALQAEWEICNGHDIAKVLPEGFNYSGVISFSGAIFSREGAIKYAKAPCPHFMCHGTADKMVNYGQMSFMKQRFAGTDIISKTFSKNGYNHQVWRFEGNGHEISITQVHMFPEEQRFLEANVMKGIKRNIDATVIDESVEVPDWAKGDYKDIYK